MRARTQVSLSKALAHSNNHLHTHTHAPIKRHVDWIAWILLIWPAPTLLGRINLYWWTELCTESFFKYLQLFTIASRFKTVPYFSVPNGNPPKAVNNSEPALLTSVFFFSRKHTSMAKAILTKHTWMCIRTYVILS